MFSPRSPPELRLYKLRQADPKQLTKGFKPTGYPRLSLSVEAVERVWPLSRVDGSLEPQVRAECELGGNLCCMGCERDSTSVDEKRQVLI